MITRTFKLCLNAGTGSAPYINVSQYDEGETWLFELYSETGERYIPSSGAIVGVKSDGHGIVNTGTVDSEGRVVITETQQMTASAGRAIYELSIDGLTHGTANFVVVVERKPTDDAVMSDSDLSLIQEAVDAATTIEDLIEGHDPDEVIADAVDAWLDAHPEATTTVEDGAITSAKLNDSVKTGVFEDMTVGTSLAVMNDEGVTDNLAYKFRQTGGDAVRELDEIVGGTIAWNQQYVSASNSSTNGVTATNNGDGTFTISGTATATAKLSLTANTLGQHKNVGHKYLFWGCPSGSASTYFMTILFIGETAIDTGNGAIYNLTDTPYTGQLGVVVKSGVTVNITVRPQFFDLTQMFGSTVADAIYAMEQSSAGSGVAYFRSLFPNSYYAYNAGELVSVEGLSAHVTTESNLFDPSHLLEATGWTVSNGVYSGKNSDLYFEFGKPSGGYPIHGFKKNTQYTFEADFYSDADSTRQTIFEFWHTDGTYERIYAAYATQTRIRVTSAEGKTVECFAMSYGNTATIHLSNIMLTEGTDGTYKPYQKHTYPLDSTLTLRGVPKWNNGLYYDGDVYSHDGTVNRKYGIVDLGSLTWTHTSSSDRQLFTAQLTTLKSATGGNDVLPAFCGRYEPSYYNASWVNGMMSYANASGNSIVVIDNSYTDAASFKSAMSGVYLVYELATPTTEQAEPYQQYQICDGKGTEEYVSTTVTPVGHNTFYPVDIVAKVNKLPSDFSTLIAPTEKGFTATRNYTAKQFLIINNQLYKVTANIANGATITPNTNVTAVTIADILTTLI